MVRPTLSLVIQLWNEWDVYHMFSEADGEVWCSTDKNDTPSVINCKQKLTFYVHLVNDIHET